MAYVIKMTNVADGGVVYVAEAKRKVRMTLSKANATIWADDDANGQKVFDIRVRNTVGLWKVEKEDVAIRPVGI